MFYVGTWVFCMCICILYWWLHADLFLQFMYLTLSYFIVLYWSGAHESFGWSCCFLILFLTCCLFCCSIGKCFQWVFVDVPLFLVSCCWCSFDIIIDVGQNSVKLFVHTNNVTDKIKVLSLLLYNYFAQSTTWQISIKSDTYGLQ